MKAQHRKIRHARRVSHQRRQRFQKLAAISDSVATINESGYEVNKKNMVPAMESRGYFFISKIARKTNPDYLKLPRNWKRMDNEQDKPKPKASPVSKSKKKVMPS